MLDRKWDVEPIFFLLYHYEDYWTYGGLYEIEEI